VIGPPSNPARESSGIWGIERKSVPRRPDHETERREGTALSEVGNMPLPKKPLERGGKGMVRISDVPQAERGCDLDFLVGASSSAVERESH